MSDAAPDPAAPTPLPRKRRRWGLHALALLLAAVAIGAGGIYWLLHTRAGAQLLLGRATAFLGKGARLEGVEGSLGGVLRVKSILIDRPDLYVRVDDLEMDSSAPFGVILVVHRLAARSVEVRTATSKEAATLPASFAPPYPVRLEEGRVGTLRLGALPPVPAKDLVLKDLLLRGEGDLLRWKVAEASVASPYGSARISGTIGNTKPFAVDVAGDFAGQVAQRDYRVTAKFGGTLKAIEAKVDGVVAGTRAHAHAVLEPFATVQVKTLTLDAADVDASRFAPALPRTRIGVHATLAPEGKAFAGPVRIVNADPGPWDRGLLPFNSASARVVVAAQRTDLSGLAVQLAGGGSASGHATLTKAGIEADLHVADVDLAALHGNLQKTKVAGRVAISGDESAQRFDVALKDPRFEVEGRAVLAHQRLDVETVRVATGGGAVAGKGTLGLAGRREFRFEGRAQHFDPSAFVKAQRGDLNFTFVTSGTLAEGIAGDARFDIAPSTYAGLPAAGRVNVSGDRRRIASADVSVSFGDAHVDAKGSFGRAGDSMDVAFRAPNLSVVAKPFGIALAGRVEGTASLSGTFQSPAGRVALTGANLALPSNVHIRELTLRAQAGADAASPIDAALQARGVALGKDDPPTAIAETVSATVGGTRAAHRLEVEATMTRDNRLHATLQGGIDAKDPGLAWNGRIESFAMTGRGAFALAAPAALFLSAARVELGDASLRGDWGAARLAVTRWTPGTLDLKGSTGGLQVQNLARSLRLGTMSRSDLVVAGEWDIHAAGTFEGTLDLKRVSGDLRVGEPPLALGLTQLTLHAEAVRGRMRGVVNVIGDRIGKVQGEGAGLIVHGATGWQFAEDSPVEGKLVADVPDLSALAAWLGPDARLGGRLDAALSVSGTGAEPRFAGGARAERLVVREPQSGFEIAEGEVALRLDGRSLAIERFVARTPWHPSEAALERIRRIATPVESGTITAEGSIDLAARQGAITVKADKVPVTQLAKRFVAVSGEARLEAGKTGLLATGAFKADAGWIGALAEALPTVSEDVFVVRASQPAAQDDLAKAKEPMRLDIKVSLNDRVRFEGRGLDTRLTGDVRITGEVGSTLRATGVIRSTGGTYEGYGQKLEIERGILTFGGPLDNPQLNVLALRKGLAVEAGVEILGTTTRPRVRLVSSPDVPEPEKLSWLVLGRGASDSSPGDASVLLAAAGALLGSRSLGSSFGRKFGIDDVKIGRADTSSNLGVLPQSTVAGRTGTPSASEVISVGKRLNGNLHLTYEQGLADAEGALKITWTLSQKFQVLVRAGFLPGIDAVYRWTFK